MKLISKRGYAKLPQNQIDLLKLAVRFRRGLEPTYFGLDIEAELGQALVPKLKKDATDAEIMVWGKEFKRRINRAIDAMEQLMLSNGELHDQNHLSKATGPLNPQYQPTQPKVPKYFRSQVEGVAPQKSHTIHSRKSVHGRCIVTHQLKSPDVVAMESQDDFWKWKEPTAADVVKLMNLLGMTREAACEMLGFKPPSLAETIKEKREQLKKAVPDLFLSQTQYDFLSRRYVLTHRLAFTEADIQEHERLLKEELGR